MYAEKFGENQNRKDNWPMESHHVAQNLMILKSRTVPQNKIILHYFSENGIYQVNLSGSDQYPEELYKKFW